MKLTTIVLRWFMCTWVSQQTDKNLWTSRMNTLSPASICYLCVFSNLKISAVARFAILTGKTAENCTGSFCQILSDKQRRKRKVNICLKWSNLKDEKGLKSQAEDATFGGNYHSSAWAHVRSAQLKPRNKKRSDSLLNSSVRKRRYPVAPYYLRNASPYWNMELFQLKQPGESKWMKSHEIQ